MEQKVRDGADRVCRVRNFWAHENQGDPGPMTIEEAKTALHLFLNELPEDW